MQTGHYHVYNRGAHKALLFNSPDDYRRFVCLLHIGNTAKPFHFSQINESKIFLTEREDMLVEIISYCLMPNHFHIVLREIEKGSKAKFLQKICTAYVMYYNIKYKHSGTIFKGTYLSKEICDENYLKTVINYVHLNPYGIYKPNLSSDVYSEPEHIEAAIAYSKGYEFSSFKDYLGEIRQQNVILTPRFDLAGLIRG